VVGVAEYQLTANVWIRGILAERHGLPVTSVRYRTDGLHAPGRVAKLAYDPPPGAEIEPIPPGATLAGMLAADASLLPWAYAEAERTRDVMGRTSGPTAWPGTRTRWLRSSGTPASRA
jgi:hypothetical protein